MSRWEGWDCFNWITIEHEARERMAEAKRTGKDFYPNDRLEFWTAYCAHSNLMAFLRDGLSEQEPQVDDIAHAVNGWKQAVSILRAVTEGLAFTVEEIEAHKMAFPTDHTKAEKFAKAKADLAFAEHYSSAMPEQIKEHSRPRQRVSVTPRKCGEQIKEPVFCFLTRKDLASLSNRMRCLLYSLKPRTRFGEDGRAEQERERMALFAQPRPSTAVRIPAFIMKPQGASPTISVLIYTAFQIGMTGKRQREQQLRYC